MSFGAGLGKFKKVHQDHMKTVLEDDTGKRITVVHSALPDHLKNQLEGMPQAFEGGGNTSDSGDSRDSQPDQKPVEVNVNTAAPSQAPAATFGNQPVEARAYPAQSGPSMLSPDQTLNAPQAVTQEQMAVREQQAVDTAKGAEIANQERGYNAQRAAIAQQDADQIKAVQQHADEFAKFNAANPINPKQYQENMGAGRKVSNALGLLLGGFGQGLIGGSNPAMDFLNAQIDRDINAQKANVENQKSVYGAYLDLYKDQQAASSAAKASMLDLYTHKANQIAAQLATPQAKAAADAFSAKAAIERNQLLIDTAGRLGNLQVGGGQTMGAAGVQPGNQAAAPLLPPSPATPQASEAERLQNAPGFFGQLYNYVVGEPEKAQAAKEPAAQYADTHILHQNAGKRWLSMPYEMKAKGAAEQIPALQHQFNQATQAEKGLQIVDPTIDRLYNYTKEGGVGGKLERAIHRVGSLPVVGQGLEAIWSAVGDDPTTRAYLADQQSLFGSISAALKGTNVGDQSIHEIVNSNLPDPRDTEAAVEKKKENIRHFIKMHTDTSLLKAHGYSPE